MLESFMVAFNAVTPFLILLGIGFGAVRLKLADRAFMDRLNALNYRLFFPFLMFNNVYSAKPENMPSVKLMLTGSLSVILLVILLVIIVPKFVKENPRRGVVIQGIFRSNFIIYGIPLTTYVFGTEKSSVCGMMIMIMVSIFNIAAVIVLELFREGGKIRPGMLLLGIVKNPLLQGCVVGLLFYLLQIRLPSFIAAPVSSLAGAATTVALVVLGANLKFDELKKNRRTISVVDLRNPRCHFLLSHGPEYGRGRAACRPAGVCQHGGVPCDHLCVYLYTVPAGSPGLKLSSLRRDTISRY